MSQPAVANEEEVQGQEAVDTLYELFSIGGKRAFVPVDLLDGEARTILFQMSNGVTGYRIEKSRLDKFNALMEKAVYL
jgi:hypothetical protein